MGDVGKNEAATPAAVETGWQKKWSAMNARVEKLEASIADWEGWWYKSADWDGWSEGEDGDDEETEEPEASSGSQQLKKKVKKTVVKKAKV